MNHFHYIDLFQYCQELVEDGCGSQLEYVISANRKTWIFVKKDYESLPDLWKGKLEPGSYRKRIDLSPPSAITEPMKAFVNEQQQTNDQ